MRHEPHRATGRAPTAAAPRTVAALGTTEYASIELSLVSVLAPKLGTEARESFAIYDRASLMLAGLTLDGDNVGANPYTYTLLLGYRSRLVAVFGGAMVGNRTIRLEEPFEATGLFMPAAARVPVAASDNRFQHRVELRDDPVDDFVRR